MYSHVYYFQNVLYSDSVKWEIYEKCTDFVFNKKKLPDFRTPK